ncbi:hypothetical protein ACSBR2_037515 [Camellia fascicularis]
MSSLNNPRPWAPYMNTKDCSQGFCSLYCPQWCYIVFPPPPPIQFPDDNPGPNFSPLVIAIIGILASAFLLVSYYAIISKYCGNTDPSRRRENHEANEESEENDDPSDHEPWHVATTGLDEALIKSITVCKYKKGDGLIESTDCSVCLSEFEDDESVRLLPKCNHAFHVPCIDTWLKSHSNCPLCRANIIFVSASPPILPPPVVVEPPQYNESLSDINRDNNNNNNNNSNNENVDLVGEDVEMGVVREEEMFQLRALSDLGSSEARDIVIEIRGEDDEQMVRRSVSMNYLCQNRVLIADVLRLNQDEDSQDHVGSSKLAAVEMSKTSHSNRVLHCVTSPVAMKRSFSGGRFSFSRRGRGRNIMMPL